MTVAELIEILSTYEPSAEVCLQYQDDGGYYLGNGELTEVWKIDNKIILA